MTIQRLQRFLSFIPGQPTVYRSVPSLLLLALLVMGLPAPSGAQQACRPDGDVDRNGSVTAADALLAFQQALRLVQLDACQLTIADVFPQPAAPDGSITASDALCIFQKALSLPSCLDILILSNQPPVVNADANPATAEAGAAVTLLAVASDPDGTIVSYLWEQTGGTAVPLSGVTGRTATFTAPGVSADETLTFRLSVNDNDGAQASVEVNVTVRQANQPPAVNAGADQTVTEGAIVVLSGTASDPDGTIVTYAWTQTGGTAVSLAGADSATAMFTAPDVSADATLTFRLTVTDNDGAQATTEVTVSVVRHANRSPIAMLAENQAYQTVNAGTVVTLSGNAIDLDGTIVSYAWTQTAGTTVTLSGDNSPIATFTAPQVTTTETLTFQFVVTDDDGATGHDEVFVIVTPPPSPGTISGTLIIGEGAVLDGDTKDAFDPVVQNSSLQGQRIRLALPVTVAGHVNHMNDEVDVYHVTLPVPADILLKTGDWPDADLDLYLADTSGEIIDASISYEQFEVIGTGSLLEEQFLVMVRASAGASNYVLSLRTYDSREFSQAYGSGTQLGAEFEPDHIIAEFKEGLDDARRDTLLTSIAGDASGIIAGDAELVEEVVTPSGPILLKFQDTFAERDSFAELDSPPGESGIGPLHHATPESARKARLLQTIKTLGFNPDVSYAEPNFINHAFERHDSLIPNDPEYVRQFHYPLINLPEAWSITTGSDDIVVAVIDSGVAFHNDLDVRLLRPGPRTRKVGYDFIQKPEVAMDGDGIDPDPTDPAGIGSDFHGTHVAGTIGAWTNNERGVAGVTWRGDIMPLRVLGPSGGADFDVAQAVLYAAGLPNSSGSFPFRSADIINMSLGRNNPECKSLRPAGEALRDAIERAIDEGVHVVIAAGNDNCDVPMPMSHIDGVITVSAVNLNGGKASFSNYGPTIDVAAPGVFVLSTMVDDSNPGVPVHIYSYSSGTSMAAPHVSGVLALMLSIHPGLSPRNANRLLAGTLVAPGPGSGLFDPITQDLGLPGRDDIYGHGLIDARRAVRVVQDLVSGTTKPGQQPYLFASPESLDFGDYKTELPIHLSKGGRAPGGGPVLISGVTTDRSWLMAEYHHSSSPFVTVRVDRMALPPGVHFGQVSIDSNAVARTVPVTVRVKNPGGNAGTVYVIVADPDNLEPVAQVMSEAAQRYEYLIPEVPAGSYIMIAGTDRDDDGLICDPGEACGVWPAIDSRLPVDVNGDQTGIDIPVSLDLITGPVESPLAGFLSGGIRLLYRVEDEALPELEEAIREALCQLDPSLPDCP